jgi:hypothetical protein
MMYERLIAFDGDRLVAEGPAAAVARSVRERGGAVLTFDAATGAPVDLDLRGSPQEVEARYAPAPPAPRGRGRPKLGVVAREVTLLPRHWEWLSAQPGGASVALRKLVEEARKGDDGAAEARRARDATYRFMSVMAGDRPGFEEAARALYANDGERFRGLIEPWPADVREQISRLAAGAGL